MTMTQVDIALSAHPNVRQCATVTEELGGELRVITYLVSNTPGTVTVPELREFLAANVPAHMIPSAFVFLAEMPVGDDGRINLHGLPDPRSGTLTIGIEAKAPHHQIEIEISNIWCEVLGFRHVDVNDHFLALGGDSLTAAGIARRIEEKVGLAIELEIIFELPTIAALAGHVSAQLNSARGNTAVKKPAAT